MQRSPSTTISMPINLRQNSLILCPIYQHQKAAQWVSIAQLTVSTWFLEKTWHTSAYFCVHMSGTFCILNSILHRQQVC